MVRHKYKNIIQVILILIAIFLISYIIKYICSVIITQKQTELLNNTKNSLTTENITLSDIQNSAKDNNLNLEGVDQNGKNAEDANTNKINTSHNKSKIKKVTEKNERMIKIEELQNENEDIKAWIEIPETQINYPVLQGTDNEFYVDHNYNKTKTKSGAIFVDMAYDWNLPSTNMLIYGHNMKNGTMFTSLMNYKNKNYYEKHSNIRLTTTNTDTTYEIISAFESKVYDNDENVFKYYDFINANNEAEFNDFITNIKELSIYDTGKTAEYGDELMTLSTCAYHTKNGRFVVVAKAIY